MNCRTTVETWSNCISALPDNKFFDIIRLYLGEIKTPYNKQRLIEQLAGFIRNEKNLSNMIALLDEFDIKILTVLSLIPNATNDTLTEFFAQEYTMADIYTEVSNLISRLLVFEEKDNYSPKKYLRVNPLVWDKLEKYIKLSNVLSTSSVVSFNFDDVFVISPNLIAAFISFINVKGCSCKADGGIKKNDLTRIQQIFGDKEKCIQLLLNSFINLSLVKEGEKSFEVDSERFELLARLDHRQQYSLLCAASCSRFSRDGLKKEAQLFLDTLSSIPDEGFTRQNIIKLAFLVGTQVDNNTAGSSKSRFSRILEAARQEALMDAEQVGSIIDRMIDSAIEFGLLQEKGKDEKNKPVYVCNQIMKAEEQLIPTDRVLNIDSTFTVTLMPGLPLKKLLPLTGFLAIKNFALVTEFEITRQSISSAFDRGWTIEKVFETLDQYSAFEIPQNLRISISDWHNSYSSAMLYQGYVLKVAKEYVYVVENNPNIKKYIKEKLADCIYLLNVPVTADISLFIEESGLDFMGRVKNPFVPGEKLAFPALRPGKSFVAESEEGKLSINFSEASELLKGLKNQLDELELSKNQRESLSHRIRQRLILTNEHLVNTSVRTEILEADGMDYSGKLHLLDAGLKENDMMEITLPQVNKENEYFKIIGKTLGITKQPSDAIVRFEVYPDHEVMNLVVSRITYLRRLKF